jgi:hypothetical protein
LAEVEHNRVDEQLMLQIWTWTIELRNLTPTTLLIPIVPREDTQRLQASERLTEMAKKREELEGIAESERPWLEYDDSVGLEGLVERVVLCRRLIRTSYSIISRE